MMDVAAHAAFFEGMASLVPPQFYLGNGSADGAPGNTKYMKNKKKPADIPEHKARRALRKAKFDPDQQKSLAQLAKEHKAKHDAAAADDGDDEDNDDDDDDEEGEDDDEDDDEDDEDEDENDDDEDDDNNDDKATQPALQEHLSGSATPLDELRAKLQSRVQQLRAERRRKAGGEDEGRDALQRKRAEKLAKKKKQKKQKQQQHSHQADAAPVPPPFPSRRIPSKMEEDGGSTVRFSKFDFGADTSADAMRKQHGPDKYGALRKAEAKAEKLAKLRTVDADKARQVEESNEWKAAMQRAQGVKVKDDPTLLRKSIKREEKRKQKSKVAWDERKKQQQDGIQMRQKRRTENIQAKIAGKSQKKSPKKHRPGFEGKKSAFMAGSKKKK